MSLILPVIRVQDRWLADVLVSAFHSVRAEDNPLRLRGVKRSVVILVDGLGAQNLTARSAHARNIATLSRTDVLSGFPTTTASALSSLMTGRSPGETGMVGYAIRNPATGAMVNQLSGLDDIDVSEWQPLPTLWEINHDVPAAILSSPRYRDSGLTRAILRGAPYVEVKTYAERVTALDEFLATHRTGIAYIYIPELDMAAHASGVQSDQWIRKLEELDGFVADVRRRLTDSDGLIITADHGVLDVPPTRHLMVPADSRLLEGVTVGGEPRFLHLYTEKPDETLSRWREAEDSRAYVTSRDDAINSGWFGTVTDVARERIGNVLVTPRGESVYYIDGIASAQSLAMIGQHGGLSRTETLVPLLRGGAYG